MKIDRYDVNLIVQNAFSSGFKTVQPKLKTNIISVTKTVNKKNCRFEKKDSFKNAGFTYHE